MSAKPLDLRELEARRPILNTLTGADAIPLASEERDTLVAAVRGLAMRAYGDNFTTIPLLREQFNITAGQERQPEPKPDPRCVSTSSQGLRCARKAGHKGHHNALPEDGDLGAPAPERQP